MNIVLWIFLECFLLLGPKMTKHDVAVRLCVEEEDDGTTQQWTRVEWSRGGSGTLGCRAGVRRGSSPAHLWDDVLICIKSTSAESVL